MISRSSRRCFTELKQEYKERLIQAPSAKIALSQAYRWQSHQNLSRVAFLNSLNSLYSCFAQCAPAAPVALVFLQSQMLIDPTKRIMPSTRKHSLYAMTKAFV